jgi:hypothetical protein
MLLIFPIYGIPASGKTTIIRQVVEKLLDQHKEKKISSVKVIELDELLEATDSPFEISTWFDARQQFFKLIADEIEKRLCCENQNESIQIIFAVDNLPLKSLRNRIRSIATKILSQKMTENENTEQQQVFFRSVFIQVDLETALTRNQNRVSKVPSEIIESMITRIEIDRENNDLVLENNNNNNNNNQEQELKNENNINFVNHFISQLLNLNLLKESFSLNEKVLRKLQLENNNDDDNDSQDKKKTFETVGHKFDLLRRQANSWAIQQLIGTKKNESSSSIDMKNFGKVLSEKAFLEVDRRILQEFSASNFDADEILSLLKNVREPFLASFLK